MTKPSSASWGAADMPKAKTTLMALESGLHQRDKWAWAVYTALRHAPGPKEKKTLWDMLTHDQQEALRVLAKHKDDASPSYEAPELPLQKGPTHDHYGKRL
jgi:hypothetical protein